MESTKWHERPDFKNLFESEIKLLQNGLGGDFQLIELATPSQDGRIVAVGWLKYGEEESKQAIKIVFPTRYPFSLPTVFALESDANGNVLPQVKLFGRGNQYANGAMCLMLNNQWNRSIDNIGSLLRRAQKWLIRVNSAEGFRKEEIVEEVPAMFPHSGQVIMGHSFPIPGNAKVGTLVLTQFKPNYYILEQNVLPSNPFLLQLNKEVFKWYAFDKGVTIKNLFPVFNLPTFLNVLQTQFAEGPQTIITSPNIGLYLPDDPNPWHFFKFGVIQGQALTGNVSYYISRIVEKELYHRTKDVFDDQLLQTKRVTIIGLGAIGSEVARSLARNGVGHFNVFDNDTFEMGNSVRHGADLFYIGENKTSVVRQLIHRSNPNITVAEFPIDVLDDDGHLEKCLQQSDLCLVLTGEERVDYFINELYAPTLDIPFIFARVAAGGISGSVQVVHHGKTACLRCLSMHGVDTLPKPQTSSEYKELGPEYGSCSSPAVPGSEVDTKTVALQISRIAIQLLLDEQTSYAKCLGHQFYWHGPFGSQYHEPFTWEIKKTDKHQDCELCNS